MYEGSTPFWTEFFLSKFTPSFKLFYQS